MYVIYITYISNIYVCEYIHTDRRVYLFIYMRIVLCVLVWI